MPLNLQSRILLSHDKEFVQHLHKALCSPYHAFKVAFLDDETVPKAEAVSWENILEEARTSKLGVLVLADEFFTHTRNTMLEFEAYVGAEMMDDMYKEAMASKRFPFTPNMSKTQDAVTSVNSSRLEEDCRYITSDVVGIRGFTILGKTTLCKCLCAFYRQELSGRVCYIDVGSMQDGIIWQRSNIEDYHRFQYLSNDQLENVLRDEFSSVKDPIFLAIDNILSKRES